MSWQPPPEINGNRQVTGYVIQCAKVGSDDKMIMNVSNDIEHAIPGLFAYAEYSITIAAVNAKGTGPFSKPVIAISGEDSELNYITTCIHIMGEPERASHIIIM